MRVKQTVFAGIVLAAAVAFCSGSASAHMTRTGWISNSATGGATFYSSTYHSSAESGGLIINGTTFSFDSQSSTSASAWASLASGFDTELVWSSSSRNFKGVLTLSHSQLTSLGLTLGANTITVNSWGSGAVWAPWGGNMTGSFFLHAVPEPTSVAMWGLGALGACVYARRRKRRQA